MCKTESIITVFYVTIVILASFKIINQGHKPLRIEQFCLTATKDSVFAATKSFKTFKAF